jgi:hypothetical protein
VNTVSTTPSSPTIHIESFRLDDGLGQPVFVNTCADVADGHAAHTVVLHLDVDNSFSELLTDAGPDFPDVLGRAEDAIRRAREALERR